MATKGLTIERPLHELWSSDQSGKEIVDADKDARQDKRSCRWFHQANKELPKVGVDRGIERVKSPIDAKPRKPDACAFFCIFQTASAEKDNAE